MDVLLDKTKDAGVPGTPGSWTSLFAVAAIWVTYFSALYLNFCDFARYAPDKASLRKGNIWGLPVNLILFSPGRRRHHHRRLRRLRRSAAASRPDLGEVRQLVPGALAALTFAVATLGINVVANFVSPAFDFSNVFPAQIDFKKGGYIAALIALVLYPFAPWEGSAASFVNIIGATMGPIFGVMMVDYYLIRKGEVDVEALYREDGEFRFQGGWHVNAFIAAGIGAHLLVDPAELHQLAAVLVGRLWLVLRRRASPASSTTCCAPWPWALAPRWRRPDDSFRGGERRPSLVDHDPCPKTAFHFSGSRSIC